MNQEIWKPFAFKVGEHYLVGLAANPTVGSPCSHCLLLWLKEKNISATVTPLNEVPLYARKKIKELTLKNHASSFFEISPSGTCVEIKPVIFAHPLCLCLKVNPMMDYSNLKGEFNLTFSPIFQIKCSRYGVGSRNIWFFSALGRALYSHKLISVHYSSYNREEGKRKVLEAWLKKAAYSDLDSRLYSETSIVGERILNDETLLITEQNLHGREDYIGAGETYEASLTDAYFEFIKRKCLKQFFPKRPIYLVGAMNFLREKVPFHLLQQYDIHLLFFPNSYSGWVVGVLALSRVRQDTDPIFSFACHGDIKEAIDQALLSFFTHSQPIDKKDQPRMTGKIKEQLNRWWNHWVYQCPKLSLREVLHLESYENSVASMKEFFKGENLDFSKVSLNDPILNKKLRFLTMLRNNRPLEIVRPQVQGIGQFMMPSLESPKHF